MTTLPMDRNPFPFVPGQMGVPPVGVTSGAPQIGATLPPAVQQQMRIDPRLAMALQARQAGADTSPVHTPLQGLARALQGAIGGWQQRRLMQEYQRDAEKYTADQKALIEALTGGDYAKAGEIAASNPYLADMGMQLTMAGAQQQQAAQRAAEERAWKEDQAAKEREFKAQMELFKIEAAQAKADRFEPVLDEAGNPIAQRNVRTGEMKALPGNANAQLKPPPGYRFTADGSRLEPIPGGPKDTSEKDAQKRVALLANIDNTISNIDKAIGQANFWSTGVLGYANRNLPTTDAYKLRQTIATIKANIGFDKLQQMRDMSPTGGALGQVAIQELDALQNSIAALDPNMGQDELMASLNAVKQHYENWKAAVLGASQGEQAGFEDPLGIR